MNRTLLPPRSGGPDGGPGGKGEAGGITGLAELNGLAAVNGLAGVDPDGGYPVAWVGPACTVCVGCQFASASFLTACGFCWYQDANGSGWSAGGWMRVR